MLLYIQNQRLLKFNQRKMSMIDKLQGSYKMTTVIITLEFENKDELDEEDVIQYLHELIEQDCLSYEVINNKQDKGVTNG